MTSHEQKKITPWRILKVTIFCLAIVQLLALSSYVHYVHEFMLRISPLGNKSSDFELTDLYFAYQQKGVPPDTNIFIVNCHNDNRDAIAEKIKSIERHNPAVIGLDIIFSKELPVKESRNLAGTIASFGHNIVLAKNIEDCTADLAFSLLLKENIDSIGKQVDYGYVVRDNLQETKRSFKPYFDEKKNKPSFPVALYQKAGKMVDESVLAKLSDENRLINYKKPLEGGFRYFILDDVPDMSDFSLEGKIIILGGWDSTSMIDKHYTPLSGYIGRCPPDMNGSEYHAQVISMLINDDLLTKVPKLVLYLIIFLFAYLFVYVFELIHNSPKLADFHHLFIEILLFLVASPVLLLLSFFLLRYCDIKLEPTNIILPVIFCGLFHSLYDSPVVKRFKNMFRK